MRVTQWGEYGVLFCLFLAKQDKGKTLSAAELAQRLKTDTLYAQQILQRLRKGGLIESIRGPQGGYKLARSPEEISFSDILTATEGDTFEIMCIHKPIDEAHRCNAQFDCSLKSVWHELREHINVFLKDKKLSELLKADNDIVRINRQVA